MGVGLLQRAVYVLLVIELRNQFVHCDSDYLYFHIKMCWSIFRPIQCFLAIIPESRLPLWKL